MIKLTLVIPMYNEQKNLKTTLPRVTEYLRARFGEAHEILFVDDGSTDGSPAAVEKQENEATRVLRNAKNHGKGYAVRQGMLAARGDIVIFTDCDLAYGTEAIGELYDLLAAEGAPDAAVASRDLHPDGYAGYSIFRRFVSRTYRAVLRLFFGLRLSDSQSGLKGFRREAAEAIFSRAEVDRYAFDFEAIMIGMRLGVRFGEMPARVIENNPGKIRFFRDSLRMMRDLFRIRRRLRKIPEGGYKQARPPVDGTRA